MRSSLRTTATIARTRLQLQALMLGVLPLALSACIGKLPSFEQGREGADGDGSVGGDGDGAGNGPGGDGDAPLEPPSCETVGPRMVRRLTATQFRNSLVDLFQDPNVPEAIVLTDPIVEGFRIDATQAVIRDLDAQQIMNYAEKVATWATDNKLGQLTTCQSTDVSCTRTFIESFGKLAYRGAVPAESVSSYADMFAAEASFAEGVEVVIAAMLQSPYFLYRRELGEPVAGKEHEYALTPHEVATNLAYTLTDHPPDAELVSAVERGELSSASDLDREFERLLASERSAVTLGSFVTHWLEYDDLVTVARNDPQNKLTPEVRRSMLRESEAFFVDLVRSGGFISDLFQSAHTFVDPNLSSFYQLPGGGGAELTKVDLSSTTRASGLLGQGSFLMRHALADSSSPVQRGKVVRERLLCQTLTPPPPTVDANLSTPPGTTTTRERYLEHSENPTCAGCHALTDPIGFTFENFDGFGLYRDQELGRPIDASGQLSGVAGGTVDLDGLNSLNEYLGESEVVRSCFTHYLSYFAFGLEDCSAESIEATSDTSIEDVLRSIVHAPQFTKRAEP